MGNFLRQEHPTAKLGCVPRIENPCHSHPNLRRYDITMKRMRAMLKDTKTQSTRLPSLPMAVVLSLHLSISPLAYRTCAMDHPRSCLSLARPGPPLFILLLSGPMDGTLQPEISMARSGYGICARPSLWRSGGDIQAACGVQNLRATVTD